MIYMFPKYSETLSMRLRGAETKWNSAGDWSMNIFTQTSSKDFDYLHNFQKTLRVGFNNTFAFSICTMQEVQISICMYKDTVDFYEIWWIGKLSAKEHRASEILSEQILVSLESKGVILHASAIATKLSL